MKEVAESTARTETEGTKAGDPKLSRLESIEAGKMLQAKMGEQAIVCITGQIS